MAASSLRLKRGALSDHQRLIRRRGVTPLMYQYGEMWSIVYDRSGSLGPAVAWSNVSHELAVMRARMRCALALPSQKPHGGLPPQADSGSLRLTRLAAATASVVARKEFKVYFLLPNARPVPVKSGTDGEPRRFTELVLNEQPLPVA